MVRHIVLFKLREHAEGNSKADNALLAKATLEALRTKIPGILALEAGVHDGSAESAYDLALSVLFDSRAALEAYLAHPEHCAAAEFIRRVRESSAAMDYDVEPSAVMDYDVEPRVATGEAVASGPPQPSSEQEAAAPSAHANGAPAPISPPSTTQGWTGGRLLGLASAFQETRVLLTGAELHLFTLLAPAPLTAPEVAAKLNADLPALQILLDALCAMGLLQKQQAGYRTDPSASDLLVDGKPRSILPMVLHRVNLWTRWSALTRIVAGPQPEKRTDDAWLRSFIGAMHVVGAPLAARIVSTVDARASRHMLDVGGASGTYTLAFLQAVPEMRATLFDRPEVIPIARERIELAGEQDRVELIGGDFYHDPLPAGHDFVFVSAIIHQNSPRQNVDLFRKAFAALESGGRIVVRDHVLNAERTQPAAGALFAVNMLVARNGGNSYTFDEIRAALETAGFVRTKLIHPDTRMDGLIEAFKP